MNNPKVKYKKSSRLMKIFKNRYNIQIIYLRIVWKCLFHLIYFLYKYNFFTVKNGIK